MSSFLRSGWRDNSSRRRLPWMPRGGLGRAVWAGGQLVECGPLTAQDLVPMLPCSLSLAIIFRQSCQRGYQCPHIAGGLWRSRSHWYPDPQCTSTALAAACLLLACTPEGHLWFPQSSCASVGLAKPANSSSMPWAEPCLLYWGLNPSPVVCPSLGTLPQASEPQRVFLHLQFLIYHR